MKKYKSERAKDTAMMPSSNINALNQIYHFEQWCEYHNVQLEDTMRDDLIKKSADKYAIQFANWLFKKQAESEKKLIAFAANEETMQIFKDETGKNNF